MYLVQQFLKSFNDWTRHKGITYLPKTPPTMFNMFDINLGHDYKEG